MGEQQGEATPGAVLAPGVVLVLGTAALARFGADPLVISGAGYVAAATAPLWLADRRAHRLPNAWVLPGYLFGGVGLTWSALATGRFPAGALAAAAGTLVFLLAIAAVGGVGMGDVKLAGVLALVLGGLSGPLAFAAALAAAFVTAGATAAGALAQRPGVRDGRVPFGPHLLGAFWAVLLCW